MSTLDTLRAFAARHPDAPIPGGLWLEALEEARQAEGPEYGTTDEVHGIVGRSAEWWQDEARAGRVKGAYQEAPGSPWLLPLAECRAHLARLTMTRSRRVPRRKAS